MSSKEANVLRTAAGGGARWAGGGARAPAGPGACSLLLAGGPTRGREAGGTGPRTAERADVEAGLQQRDMKEQ